MIVPVGIWLRCGCCGEDFRTWEGYEDQDQDSEYGICFECQGDIGDRNEQEFDKLIDAVRGGLSPANLLKFNKKSRDWQKSFAFDQLNKGNITYSIVPHSITG